MTKIKIIIVDDEPASINLIENYLKQIGNTEIVFTPVPKYSSAGNGGFEYPVFPPSTSGEK
jgi:CheY-like chemotaxis protein